MCLIGNLFSWGVVGFLDEISLEYDVLSNFSIPVDLFNYTERRQNPRNIDAQIIFQYVVSNKIKEHEASWWYEYQFIFYCYYGNAHINRVGKPILKTDLDNIKKDNGRLKLNSVRQRLNYYLRYGIDIINVFNIQPLSYGILGISIEDPTYSLTPFIDGPPTLPPTPSPSYYETINDDLLFNDTDPMTTTINGTKSNGGTGEDNNGSGDDDDNMSPPSGTGNDGVAKNESTYDNYPDKTEGTYPEFVTYTSPIDVQLWVRDTFTPCYSFVPIYSSVMLLILKFLNFLETGLAPIFWSIYFQCYTHRYDYFDAIGSLPTSTNYETNDMG